MSNRVKQTLLALLVLIPVAAFVAGCDGPTEPPPPEDPPPKLYLPG